LSRWRPQWVGRVTGTTPIFLGLIDEEEYVLVIDVPSVAGLHINRAMNTMNTNGRKTFVC
jgi:hypothetical protein